MEFYNCITFFQSFSQSLFHAYLHSFIPFIMCHSLSHLSFNALICACMQAFIQSSIHSFQCSFNFGCLFSCSSLCVFTCNYCFSFISSFMSPTIHLSTHSFIQPFIHAFLHSSCIQAFRCFPFQQFFSLTSFWFIHSITCFILLMSIESFEPCWCSKAATQPSSSLCQLNHLTLSTSQDSLVSWCARNLIWLWLGWVWCSLPCGIHVHKMIGWNTILQLNQAGIMMLMLMFCYELDKIHLSLMQTCAYKQSQTK